MRALDRAIATIERHFGRPKVISRVRALIRGDRDIIRCRYVVALEDTPACTLDQAIAWVRVQLRVERNKRQAAINLWRRYSGTNTRLFYLQDAALMMRWLRRYDAKAWPRWRDEILQREMASEAAE